jgi:hypothetical protein
MSLVRRLIDLVLVCTCFSFHTFFDETAEAQNASEIHGQADRELNRTSKNGFSAMVFFTEDLDFPKKFAEGGDITLNATTFVRVNTPFLLTVSFSGPGIRSEGDAKVVLDITIIKPDGTTYFEAKDVPGWEGRYTARVKVRDKVKGIDLPIEKTFNVER